MTDPIKRLWTWFCCKTELFDCYLIFHEKEVVHASFSATSQAEALAFLKSRGDNLRKLHVQSDLPRFACRLLSAYAAGQETMLPFPSTASPFWEKGTPFQHRVWEEIRRIPYGTTRTYGELARRLGKLGGARAVGQACHRNPLALVVPCHRVVAAHGPGGFAGEIEIKQRLLTLERSRSE